MSKPRGPYPVVHSFRGAKRILIERMSDSAVERMLAECGNSACELAKRCHRDNKTVRAILHARGLMRMSDHMRPILSRLSGPALTRVWIESRMNLKDAAARLGVKDATLWKELKRRGVWSKRYGYRRRVVTRSLLHRWHVVHKVPVVVIARKLGFKSRTAIARRMRTLGVPRNQGDTRPLVGRRWGPLPFTKPADWDDPADVIERRCMEEILAGAARRSGS